MTTLIERNASVWHHWAVENSTETARAVELYINYRPSESVIFIVLLFKKADLL